MGWIKCNVYASFSMTECMVGISICIRDDTNNFIGSQTHWYTPIIEVYIGKTIGLFLAIKWVRKLGYKDVIFEMNAKIIVDAFNSNQMANNEFGFFFGFKWELKPPKQRN